MKQLAIVTFILLFSLQPGTAQSNLPTKPPLRILSFNTLHGATTKGDFNLDVLADLIKKLEPDLVALQEVDFLTKRAKKMDLATELGQRTSMAPLFGRAMYYNGGEYGVGILSKYTFLSSRNINLPFSPGKEPRTALEATVVIASGDTVSLIATHLDHQKDGIDRVNQVKKINAVFLENSHPTILAGDFNDVPKSKAIELLEKHWMSSYDKSKPAPTYPSENPKIKIDYVFSFPAQKWTVISSEVICDPLASDHCVYLVTLQLNP
jgi:endonuclease/exonuclease/phosphatase family metal-dependent hydrolase